jgi:broad specificity polyphosphatase/5'/3'-nucleotidase SurE
MTTPLINPASIRISFLNEEGSLTEVSGPTLGAVAIAISAELQRRDRNYREPVIHLTPSRLEQALTNDREAADLPHHSRNLNLPAIDDDDDRGHYTEAE